MGLGHTRGRGWAGTHKGEGWGWDTQGGGVGLGHTRGRGWAGTHKGEGWGWDTQGGGVGLITHYNPDVVSNVRSW